MVDGRGGARIVFKIDGVGQRFCRRYKAARVVGLRPGDGGQRRRLTLVLKVFREIEDLERISPNRPGAVYLEVSRQPGPAVGKRNPGDVGAHRLERRGRRVVLVVSFEFLDRGQRDRLGEVVVLTVLLTVQLGHRRHRCAVGIAIQDPQRVEKLHQIAGRADLRARRAVQDAAGQDR